MANGRQRARQPLILAESPFEVSLEGGAAGIGISGAYDDGGGDSGGSVGALLPVIIPPPSAVTFGNPAVFYASTFLSQASISSTLISPTFTGGLAPFTLVRVRQYGGGALPTGLTYIQSGLSITMVCTNDFIGNIEVTYQDALGRPITGAFLLGLGNFGPAGLNYTRMGGFGGVGSGVDVVTTSPFGFTPPGSMVGFTYEPECVIGIPENLPFAPNVETDIINGVPASFPTVAAPFTAAYRIGGTGVPPNTVYCVGYVFAQKNHPAPFTQFASDIALLTFNFT